MSHPVKVTNDSDGMEGMSVGFTTVPEQSSVIATPPDLQCDLSGSQSVQEQLNDDVPRGFARVTSPFGRIVKPVNRLINTMSRQDLSYDPEGYVKTICKSVVQAFRD